MINIAKVCSIKFEYNVLSKNLEKIQPNAKMKYFVSKIYLIKIMKTIVGEKSYFVSLLG